MRAASDLPAPYFFGHLAKNKAAFHPTARKTKSARGGDPGLSTPTTRKTKGARGGDPGLAGEGWSRMKALLVAITAGALGVILAGQNARPADPRDQNSDTNN